MSEEGHGHEPLIIKRHGGGHEEGHHGGVWKIAFADFMTAMMAFFLVMWLISANDKTKATIAKYFNPIELVDSTPQPVGLNNSKKGDPSVQKKTTMPVADGSGKEAKPADKAPPGAPADGAPAKPMDLTPLDDADQSAKHEELDIIRDPYAVIEEIATKASVDPPKQAVPKADQPPAGSGAAGLKNGEAFRDPFEPQSASSDGSLSATDATSPAVSVASPGVPAKSDAGPAAANAPSPGQPPAAIAAGLSVAAPSSASPGNAPAPAADKNDGKPLSLPGLRARIAALGKQADSGAPVPNIEVRRTDEGTLISLTDSADFAMFASASARPSPKTVALMEKIGHLLKSQKGDVTIRGFTDSRPFHSDTYDNWRLSTERAHIAQYMLLRGGLEEMRIDRVEGYADRHPKLPKEPEAAENRRIEILLRNPTP